MRAALMCLDRARWRCARCRGSAPGRPPGRRSGPGGAPCRFRRRSPPARALPPMTAAQSASRHGAGHAHLALAAHFGAADGGVFLVEAGPRHAAVSRKSWMPAAVRAGHRSGGSSASPPARCRPRRWLVRVTTRPPAAFPRLTAMAYTLTQSRHAAAGLLQRLLLGGCSGAVQLGGAALDLASRRAGWPSVRHAALDAGLHGVARCGQQAGVDLGIAAPGSLVARA